MKIRQHLIVAVASAALAGATLLIPSKNVSAPRRGPFQWEPYSDTAKSNHLHDGKTVIVFVYAEMSPASEWALQQLDADKLSRLFPDDRHVGLMLKYDNWNDPNIRSVWKDVGHSKEPFLVKYVPRQEPIRLDPFTLEP